MAMSFHTHVLKDWLYVLEGFYLPSVSPGIILCGAIACNILIFPFFVYPGTCFQIIIDCIFEAYKL